MNQKTAFVLFQYFLHFQDQMDLLFEKINLDENFDRPKNNLIQLSLFGDYLEICAKNFLYIFLKEKKKISVTPLRSILRKVFLVSNKKLICLSKETKPNQKRNGIRLRKKNIVPLIAFQTFYWLFGHSLKYFRRP